MSTSLAGLTTATISPGRDFVVTVDHLEAAVPRGARVLSAVLTLTDVVGGSTQSTFTVHRLLRAVRNTTLYEDLGGSTGAGPSERAGDITEPLANLHSGTSERSSCDVTSAVQQWANGATTFGLLVRAGAEGASWTVWTGDAPDVANRPLLTILSCSWQSSRLLWNIWSGLQLSTLACLLLRCCMANQAWCDWRPLPTGTLCWSTWHIAVATLCLVYSCR